MADSGVRVEVRLFATVREAAGTRALTLDVAADATVGAALSALEAAHPDLRGRLLDGDEVSGAVTVLKNGRNVANAAGTATPLADGDRLSVTPPVTGG